MQWITIRSVVDCLYKQAQIPRISEARLYVMVYSKHERNVTNRREVMRVFILSYHYVGRLSAENKFICG